MMKVKVVSSEPTAYTMLNTGEMADAEVSKEEVFNVADDTMNINGVDCYVFYEERYPVYISVEDCEVLSE